MNSTRDGRCFKAALVERFRRGCYGLAAKKNMLGPCEDWSCGQQRRQLVEIFEQSAMAADLDQDILEPV
jgi:hypothetical protein